MVITFIVSMSLTVAKGKKRRTQNNIRELVLIIRTKQPWSIVNVGSFAVKTANLVPRPAKGGVYRD